MLLHKNAHFDLYETHRIIKTSNMIPYFHNLDSL